MMVLPNRGKLQDKVLLPASTVKLHISPVRAVTLQMKETLTGNLIPVDWVDHEQLLKAFFPHLVSEVFFLSQRAMPFRFQRLG